MKILGIVLIWLGLFLLLVRHPREVKASDDCLVVDVQYDVKPGNAKVVGSKSAMVVFNCGAAMITIHEPVWP